MDVFPITVDEDVYEIPVSVVDEWPSWSRSSMGVTPATYSLKTPVLCPHCFEPLQAVHVIGIGNSHPTNASSASERSLIVACPECNENMPASFVGL